MKSIKVITLFVLLFLFGTKVFPQKIYEWRNIDRSGIYNETNLLKAWPEEGPQLA
ncbi:MAG: hypothetical protein P1P88_16625 [Bacteroidales bacterium]|nr:hypothetical protein [Bacteroidales bacterium]